MGLRERLVGLISGSSKLTEGEKEDASFSAFRGVLGDLVNSGNQDAQRISALLDEHKIAVVTYQSESFQAMSMSVPEIREAPGFWFYSVDNREQLVKLFLILNTNLAASLRRRSHKSFEECLSEMSRKLNSLYLQGISPHVFQEKDRQEILQIGFPSHLKGDFGSIPWFR